MGRGFYLLLALAALASASIPASAIVNSVDTSRQRRSLKIAAKIPLIKKIPISAKAHFAKIPVIGTLFGLHATPEIPHLGTYPIWKVHRYHGISLQPVPYPGERIPSNLPLPPNQPGEAPSIVNVPDPNYAPVDAPAVPANEYGPPASAPYSSAPYSSAPYSPVYNAPLSSRDPRGPVSTAQASSASAANSGSTSTAFANAGSASNAFANSGSASNSFANSGSIEGELDLSTLQTLLPPEIFNKVQVYASTPGGQEKVRALLGIANNARKLKFNAAHSIQGMFQKIFGGAGGSTDVALNSGTWTNVPEIYPATQGIFNSFRAVGTGISGSLIPALPEVPPLPEIPGLQTLPPAPQLPYINMPDIRPLSTNGLGGSYVSIQLPQAPQPKEAYTPPSAAYAPAHEYGPPAQSYGPPAQSYGPPAQSYGPPAQTYGPPAQTYGPPAQTYDPPVQQYSPPPQQYSVPEIPSTSYGTPVGPVYSYPQSSGSSSSSFFQAPQQTYGTPDASFAASENQEQYEGRNREAQEEAESSDSQPQVPLKTTKLQRVQDSRPLRGEALRAYLDSQRGFRPSHQDQKKQTGKQYFRKTKLSSFVNISMKNSFDNVCSKNLKED